MDNPGKYIVNLFIRHSEPTVSRFDENFLYNSAVKRKQESGSLSIEDYLYLLERDENERKEYLNSLQVGYSIFFRNTLTYDILDKLVLTEFFEAKKDMKNVQIRVWSAACAGGQEAYSMAILLEEHLNHCKDRKCNYLIFATDKDARQIKQANAGIYFPNMLENMSLKYADKWFIHSEGKYVVKPELKKNIDFSEFDLFNDQFGTPPSSVFGDFDIVICANLLFYYKPDFRKIIIEKMARAMGKNGILITSETEREILLNSNFREIYPQSAIFKIK